ncbi:MAG: type II toxin-antitoxin system VapC family toxin [Pseudomonadota bacterium]
MNLLLDTHCLIWALTDAPELGQKARRAIAAASSVWFSEASIWELGLKWRKGKIALQPRRIVEQALRDRFRPLPITLEAILLSSELRHRHGDPFDRLLYAQARENDCRLLTIDRTLAEFGARVLRRK